MLYFLPTVTWRSRVVASVLLSDEARGVCVCGVSRSRDVGVLREP